jgi:AAA domain
MSDSKIFDIREYVCLDSKNRAACPACHLSKGTTSTNKNLSVFPGEKEGVWAYKCYRGCTKEEIRGALGKSPDRLIPTALATPPKKVTVTPRQVNEAHEKLLTSNNCLSWLLDRGIPLEAIKHYKLGAVRSKVGSGYLPAISIPIPSDDDRTHYYQKKRIAPWMEGADRKDASAWSQYGIPPMVYFTHSPAGATETILCEGEWDAIRLGWEFRHTDEVAIACFTCGAGNVPIDQELTRLPGKVTIFYDLDDPGTKGAIKVQGKLGERSAIGIVPHQPDHPKGWDISDALSAGYSVGDISEAVSNATPWAAPKKPNALRDRLLTNDELMASAQDFVEWLVPDILTPDELFILGMPPRGGKSLFCLTLAKAVATGGHFLDRPVTQGAVIYVNLEDNPTKIKQRQIAQSWGENLPVYWLDKFKLSELDNLKELADDLPDLRLVVLDTFSRVRDDNQKESSAELGKTLEPLQEWAKERGICVLITHHTGKVSNDAPNADPFDMLRGSTSIRATCRGAIVIVPGDSSYRLLAENGFRDRLDVSVRINSDTLEWKLLGNWTPRIDGDMKTQIIDHLNLTGDATVAEITAALNFNASSVSTIMSRLHRDNLVSKVAGKGRSPAIYKRSSNLLKQLDVQFEHPNVDATSDTDLLKQYNLPKEPLGKVINEGESDQLIDHISKKPPTQSKLFEQSHRQDGASDVCSNSKNQSLSYEKQTHVENQDFPLDAAVIYSGTNQVFWNLCREKPLTIVSVTKDKYEITSEGWSVTQVIPKADLKLIK